MSVEVNHQLAAQKVSWGQLCMLKDMLMMKVEQEIPNHINKLGYSVHIYHEHTQQKPYKR
jgi:hypothetical protein